MPRTPEYVISVYSLQLNSRFIKVQTRNTCSRITYIQYSSHYGGFKVYWSQFIDTFLANPQLRTSSIGKLMPFKISMRSKFSLLHFLGSRRLLWWWISRMYSIRVLLLVGISLKTISWLPFGGYCTERYDWSENTILQKTVCDTLISEHIIVIPCTGWGDTLQCTPIKQIYENKSFS